MIQRGTSLVVADNSGAKRVACIGIPKRSNTRLATLGDEIVVAVKGAQPNGLVKDHQVCRAVVVRLRKEFRRDDGSYIRFDDNAVVLINSDGLPVGSRVFGPVARELRDKGFLRIVSLAAEVW